MQCRSRWRCERYRISGRQEAENWTPRMRTRTAHPARGRIHPSAWLAVGERHRTEVGARTVGVCASPQSAGTQTSTPLIFLCQDLSKALAAGTWLGVADEAVDLALAFRTARRVATARRGALPAVVARTWRRSNRQLSKRGSMRVRDMHRTGSGLQSRRNVLEAESDFIEAVGQRRQHGGHLPGNVHMQALRGSRGRCDSDLLAIWEAGEDWPISSSS